MHILELHILANYNTTRNIDKRMNLCIFFIYFEHTTITTTYHDHDHFQDLVLIISKLIDNVYNITVLYIE